MDETPGGKDESKVPTAKRLNAEVDLTNRVQLLISTVTLTLFAYVSQVAIALMLSQPLQAHLFQNLMQLANDLPPDIRIASNEEPAGPHRDQQH